MKYGLTLVTAATIYPVTLAEAKKQVEDPASITYNDLQIETQLIPSAVGIFQKRTGRQLINATYDLKLDRFPRGTDPIYIPKSPLSSVSSITYTDENGTSQTLATSVYKVITSREPSEIHLKYNQSWPAIYAEDEVVTVRFVAGYGATVKSVNDAMPEARQAILMLIGHWLANREAVLVGSISKEIELSFVSLCEACMVGDEFHEYAT